MADTPSISITDVLVPRAQRGTIKWDPERYGLSTRGVPLEVWVPAGDISFLIFAGIHGDEAETTVLLSNALRSIPREELKGAVVLAANPDGLIRGTRCNANGVDLNRNFPAADWTADAAHYRWSVDSPRDVELSPGKSAGSETETQALLKLVKRWELPVIALHSPLACIDDPEHSELGAWLAEQSRLPHVDNVGYKTPGSFGTWAKEQRRTVITYELPRESPDVLSSRHGPVLTALLTGGAPS
jgi:protein MpaA